MNSPKIIRHDISSHPDAPSRIFQAPELREQLVTAGFASLGFIETLAPGLVSLETLRFMLSEQDAQHVFHATEKGVVDEIFTAPDKRAFALIENHFGTPVISLLTITEKGLIVETTAKPVYQPKAGARIALEEKTTLKNLPRQIGNGLRRLSSGGPALWARQHQPIAGYHLRFVETTDPAALWNAHQQHIQVLLADHPAIPPHDSLRLYTCIKIRTIDIIDGIGSQFRFVILATGFLYGFISLFLLASMGIYLLILQPDKGYIGLLLLLLLLLLYYPIVALLVSVERKHVRPNLPGPRLSPVAELMPRVEL